MCLGVHGNVFAYVCRRQYCVCVFECVAMCERSVYVAMCVRGNVFAYVCTWQCICLRSKMFAQVRTWQCMCVSTVCVRRWIRVKMFACVCVGGNVCT